jgi:Na+/H+ antiporter NhaD/arsenite permease-like protein
MDGLAILVGVVFLLGYLGISFLGEKTKTAIALVTGCLSWFILAASGRIDHLEEKLFHAGSEIFAVVAFLFAAMALVEILNEQRFFDLIRAQIYRFKLGDKWQFVVIMVITALLSAVIDNLTTAISMTNIAVKFFRGKNLLIAAAGVISAANIGGAASPIGDVTTFMIWQGGKASAWTIMS